MSYTSSGGFETLPNPESVPKPADTDLGMRVSNLEASVQKLLAGMEELKKGQVPAADANAVAVPLDEMDRLKLNVHKIMRHVFGANEANLAQPVVPPSR